MPLPRWLIILAILGAAFVVEELARHVYLRGKWQRLHERTGIPYVKHGDEPRVVPIRTDEPLEFAWRVFVPGGRDLCYSTNFFRRNEWSYLVADRQSITQFSDGNCLVRCYVRRHRQGGIELSERRDGIGIYQRNIAPVLSTWIKDPARQLRIDWQDQPRVVQPEEIVTVLRITICDELRRKILAESKDAQVLAALDQPLYEMRFGTGAAFRRAASPKE